MLFSVLRSGGSFSEILLTILILAFCVLLSLTVHELCHGLAAYWMGDKTAKQSGRLSMNPLHHLEPMGALCLFLFGFGWARPVPVNPWNFKHKKVGMVLTSLAGPFSNFLLAFLAQVGASFLLNLTFASDTSATFRLATVCYILCQYLVTINLGLGLFNLIPIPPLDGSKVLNSILPARIYFKLMEYERYGFIILIILINLPFFNQFLYFCEDGILSLFNNIISLFIH
ncbi:MAG: site-2 protease family protein [Clostridia bacterium]|nr:site-2 protease family protein [Clostridia bacterium]